jgi:transposase InsO family protein
MQIVRQRARLKTIIQSILHAHLVPPCLHADLLGPKGRNWLLAQPLPPDEIDAVTRHMREHDRLSNDLRVVEREIAHDALANPDAKRLMTVPGIDMVVAIGLLAAIGPVTRFDGPDKLVSYLGPGPLRAFYERVARRRGVHIAAVAVARKLAVIIWHLLRKGEDYAWVRPALHAKKLRDLELRSGQPARRRQRGACPHLRAPGAPRPACSKKGKIKRWHQTLKHRIENHYLPGELEAQVAAFVEHYNHRRAHESLQNLTPADVYFGRGPTILRERERIKRQTIQRRRLLHHQQAP